MTVPSLLDQQESKKDFTLRLLALSLPIMLQNLLSSSVSFVDTLMIGQVGEDALAAVGLANQMFFLISLFFFGVSSGAAIFIAQFWGANDRQSMHSVMGIALRLGLLGAGLCSFVSLLFPEAIMHIFTDDPVVVAKGKEYLLVVGVSYVFTAIVMIYSTALRSTGDAKTPLYIACFSMSLNVFLNYLLILGKWGFPRMEVSGAALATTVSRGMEMILLLGFIYTKKRAVAAPIKSLFSSPRPLVKRYFTTCLPVIFNEVFWALGMTTYKIAFSRMGIDVIASVNVSEAIQGLFFCRAYGNQQRKFHHDRKQNRRKRYRDGESLCNAHDENQLGCWSRSGSTVGGSGPVASPTFQSQTGSLAHDHIVAYRTGDSPPYKSTQYGLYHRDSPIRR